MSPYNSYRCVVFIIFKRPNEFLLCNERVIAHGNPMLSAVIGGKM